MLISISKMWIYEWDCQGQISPWIKFIYP